MKLELTGGDSLEGSDDTPMYNPHMLPLNMGHQKNVAIISKEEFKLFLTALVIQSENNGLNPYFSIFTQMHFFEWIANKIKEIYRRFTRGAGRVVLKQLNYPNSMVPIVFRFLLICRFVVLYIFTNNPSFFS